MKQQSLILLSVLFVLISSACNRQKEYIVPTTWQVYPTETGKYRIYHVWETTYTSGDTLENEYYLKEEMGAIDTSLDNLHRPVRLVTNYRSPINTGSSYDFSVDRLWAVYKDTTSYLEEIVNGRRYMQLKFPMYAGSQFTWNPTVNIDDATEDKEFYHYRSVDTTFSVGNTNYEHSVFLQEGSELESGRLDTIGVSYRKAFSVYAPNIGKVYRYYKKIAYKNSGSALLDTEKSRTIIMELVEHN